MVPAALLPKRLSRGPVGVLLLVAGTAGLAMLGVGPVRSQALDLVASAAPDAVSVDDPWSDVWDFADVQDVPLSAQNLVAPFGGGTVDVLSVRALYGDGHIYLLLEWPDPTVDDTANDVDAFTDAAAVQFPRDSGTATPYTMGSAEAPVNIWQWKAVWQADVDSGFAGSRDRYPNTYSDYYPNREDDLYRPALDLGNPIAQRDRATPIENLVAAGFGTLTTSEVQDVVGSGEWRDGRWRALFARQLEPSADGAAAFVEGEVTQIAFAVWDGGADDRNGQKSLAQFIDLSIGEGATPPAPPDAAPPFGRSKADPPWAAIALLIGASVLVVLTVYAGSRAGRGSSTGTVE